MATRKKRSPVIINDPLEGVGSADAEETPIESSAPAVKTEPKPKAKAKKRPEVESEEMTKAGTGSSQFNLGDSLCIQDVTQAMEDMMPLIDLGSAITINGGDVGRTDGAGLQLLCMLMKTGKEKGIEISWGPVSDAITDGARLLGLQERLQSGRSE